MKLPSLTCCLQSSILVIAAITPLSASAVALDVPNGNFEVDGGTYPDGLYDGQDAYMEHVSQSWHQFDFYGNGGPTRYCNPAVGGNTVTIPRWADSGFGGNAPDGDHVGIAVTRFNDDRFPSGAGGSVGDYPREFEAIGQLLEDVLFQPSESYTLTVAVGHPPGGGPPEGGTESYAYNGYRIQLLAGGEEFDSSPSSGIYDGSINGGTVIAQDDNTVSIAYNTFQTITVTYTPGSLTPTQEAELEGEPIQILLCALEGPDRSITSIVAFDSVSLDGPEPPLSEPLVLSISPPGDGETNFSLHWNSQSGTLYKVLTTDNLTTAWTPIESDIVSTPPTNTYEVAPNGPTRFYKVEDQPVP